MKLKISIKEYEFLMIVCSKDGDNVEFLGKLKGDVVEELLFIFIGEESFVLFSLVGFLDLVDIFKIVDEIEE